MCDYSLEHLASRPARNRRQVGYYKLQVLPHGRFLRRWRAEVAVCLRPGTELAFDREIRIPARFLLRSKKLGEMVARFRQVNIGCREMHHDALELPDGEIILVTRLCEGQTATVIQLPAVHALDVAFSDYEVDPTASPAA